MRCVPNVMPGTVPETCNSVDDDCNGMVDDGPSFQLCPAGPNASGSCTQGACSFSCNGLSFSSCDNSWQNGCEVNTTSDPEHCGRCRSACDTPHAVERCASSRCEIESCEAGFVDLNRDYMDGCEYVCPSSPGTQEACSNQVDDDCDGLTDERDCI